MNTHYPQDFEQLSDEALLALYQATGDDEVLAEQAFNLLYGRHTTPLWNYISYKASTREDAEDIFVETWCAAIKSMQTLTLRATFTGWLFGVARNTIAAHYPRRQSGPNPTGVLQPGSRRSAKADYSLDELLISLEGDLGTLVEILHDPDEANNPVWANLRQEEVTLLFGQALPRLRKRSPVSFEIIYLAYFAGLSNAEIAEELQKSVGAIKTAKSRAHTYLTEILRELLDQMDEGPGWFER